MQWDEPSLHKEEVNQLIPPYWDTSFFYIVISIRPSAVSFIACPQYIFAKATHVSRLIGYSRNNRINFHQSLLFEMRPLYNPVEVFSRTQKSLLVSTYTSPNLIKNVKPHSCTVSSHKRELPLNLSLVSLLLIQVWYVSRPEDVWPPCLDCSYRHGTYK